MPATARPTQAHSHAGGATAGAKPKLYNRRHPERTLLYQTIAEHFETWFELASAGQFDGHDNFVAYSCKGRGVCPSCNKPIDPSLDAVVTGHEGERLIAVPAAAQQVQAA